MWCIDQAGLAAVLQLRDETVGMLLLLQVNYCSYVTVESEVEIQTKIHSETGRITFVVTISLQLSHLLQTNV